MPPDDDHEIVTPMLASPDREGEMKRPRRGLRWLVVAAGTGLMLGAVLGTYSAANAQEAWSGCSNTGGSQPHAIISWSYLGPSNGINAYFSAADTYHYTADCDSSTNASAGNLMAASIIYYNYGSNYCTSDSGTYNSVSTDWIRDGFNWGAYSCGSSMYTAWSSSANWHGDVGWTGLGVGTYYEGY
jgi:hypothetical protein